MTGKLQHRSVTPIISYFRKILRGRSYIDALRFADNQAARTQPPPDVPGGPYHKTTKIYYYTRDARREFAPPSIIAPSAAQLGAGNAAAAKPKHITPSEIYLKD